jgi:hypothetical protein
MIFPEGYFTSLRYHINYRLTIAKAPYPAVTGSVGINLKCLRISTEKLGGIHLLKITLPPEIRVYHFSDFSSNENATGKMQNQHSGKHSRRIIFEWSLDFLHGIRYMKKVPVS